METNGVANIIEFVIFLARNVTEYYLTFWKGLKFWQVGIFIQVFPQMEYIFVKHCWTYI